MKKEIIPFLLLVLLLIPMVFSLELEMKDSYLKQETLIAKIPGEFLTSLTKDNIYFYKRHVRIPMEFELSKLDNSYYLYAVLPDISENYSIAVTGVQYKYAGKLSTEDITKNFTITETNADFNINPGFVKTSESFSVNVQNLKSENIEISIKTNNESSSTGFFASLFGNNEEDSEKLLLKAGETKKVTFQLTDFAFSSIETIEFFYLNTSCSFLVYVTPEIVDSTDEKEKVNEEDKQITIISNTTTTSTDTPSVNQQNSAKSCSELSGKICSSNQECSGESRYANDGKCCLGTCEEKSNNITLKIIGWAMVILVLVLIYWFFIKKYFGVKREANILDVKKR